LRRARVATEPFTLGMMDLLALDHQLDAFEITSADQG